LAILFFTFFLLIKDSKAQKIFNLIGEWEGINISYSIEKGEILNIAVEKEIFWVL